MAWSGPLVSPEIRVVPASALHSPSAALRHVLITVRDSEDGPVARALDLRTGLGLCLEGGESCDAAVADGDMVLRIGHHVVMVLKVNEGDAIDTELWPLKVYWTPGHTTGGMCLYNAERRILFSGDTVFPDGYYGRYDGESGSFDAIVESLRKLNELDIRTRFDVQVVLVRRRTSPTQRERLVPGPEFTLQSGDVMLLVGTREGLQRLAVL